MKAKQTSFQSQKVGGAIALRHTQESNKAPRLREGATKTIAANCELQGCRWDPPLSLEGGSSAIPLNHQWTEHHRKIEQSKRNSKCHHKKQDTDSKEHTLSKAWTEAPRLRGGATKTTAANGELQGCCWDPPLPLEGVLLRFP